MVNTFLYGVGNSKFINVIILYLYSYIYRYVYKELGKNYDVLVLWL